MPRVTRGNKKLLRRKKILKLAKGFWGAKRKNYRVAKEAVEKSMVYAYRDRRNRKRDFRHSVEHPHQRRWSVNST